MKDENKKSGRSGKRGGKPHYKDMNKSLDEKLTITNGSNDVHWYGNDEVLRLAGNLSFFKSLGTRVETFTQCPYPGTVVRETIPGIMFINIRDTLPPSGSSPEVDAINIAAKQQYALIRKANSGAKNYEWNDLIIYEMARSSLNQIYAFLCRAYGLANTYSMQNRYLPIKLLDGMGFDANDFIANLASIRLYINNLAKRINTMALPHSLSYFERKAWLYSHVYTDSSSAKAQWYVLTPGYDADTGAIGNFLFYDATVLSTGGCLRPVSIFSTGDTFDKWKLIVDSFVDAILADDDCAIISGDILKAYGADHLFTCNPIPEDFKTIPVCDYEVLSQIENLTVAPASSPTAVDGETDVLRIATQKGWIVQDGAGNLLSGPYFAFSTDVKATQMYMHDAVLNYHKTDVTPSDVMVGTRLTTIFGNYVAGANTYLWLPVVSSGTEIVTSLRVAYDPGQPLSSIQGCVNAAGLAGVEAIYDLMAFDWCPKVMFYYEVAGSYSLIPPLGDYETYRVVTRLELNKLHDTAILYMLAVPLIENYSH